MKDQKIKSIQGFRFVAFLGVFLSHSKVHMGGAGAFGVSVFLLLSGFLLVTRSHQKGCPGQTPVKYAIHKISGLYRLHIIMMVACLLLVLAEMYLESNLDLKVCLLAILTNTFLIQTYLPVYKVYALLNGPSWYLCVAFLTYLVYPFVFKRIKDASAKRCIGMIAAAILLEMGISSAAVSLPQVKTDNFSAQWLTYYFPPSRLLEFLIGCFLGQLYETKQYHNRICDKKSISTGIEAGIVLLLALFLVMYQNNIWLFQREYLKYSLLVLPFAIVSLWIPLFSSGVLRRLMESKLFVWLGNISGQCYLIHMFVIRLSTKAAKFLRINVPIWIIIFISMAVTILLSVLYLHLDKKWRMKLE